MSLFDGMGIYCTNFKCFGDERVGIDQIKPINLIVGRNNSGKSSFLDLVRHATLEGASVEEFHKRNGKDSELIFGTVIKEEHLLLAFPIPFGHSGDVVNTLAQGLIGARCFWYPNKGRACAEIRSDGPLESTEKINGILDRIGNGNIANHFKNGFLRKMFVRVAAERNIISESDSDGLYVQPGGGGATNVMQRYINKVDLPSKLIEKLLLDKLNLIFQPDANFTDIVCQQHAGGPWEIFLEEDGKGRIPLSQSGSGIKTVILVLLATIVTPHIYKRGVSSFIFAFEELENNLHPSLLRRLLAYISNFASEEKCAFFLTTHSGVMIDMFAKDEDAQIIHVTHDGKNASLSVTQTAIDNHGVLDDLDIRASDLLQANAIIWVEGPSDRIYLNRWVELWSGGELKEGAHYQCVLYGGRLLSHLSSEDPDDVVAAVSILKVNRHAVVVIDSDKREDAAPINATKRRVVDEVTTTGGIAWVTRGKEIENYVPKAAVAAWLELSDLPSEEVPQYGSFFEYLEEIVPGEGSKYEAKKPKLAELLLPHMTRDNLSHIPELGERLDELCETLKRWNSIS
jgi:putative ATP-dependent endonuclease of the OLD family